MRLKDDPTFTVGVQWHAEWEPHTHELSRRLFEASARPAVKAVAPRMTKATERCAR